jgi:oligosaccharide repeat unit polymerase
MRTFTPTLVTKSIEVEDRPTSGTMLVEVGLTAAPLLLALIQLISGSYDNASIRLLVLVLFFSSIGLFLFRLRRGINHGHIAGIILAAGFIVWYAFPAFVSYFFLDYQLDYSVYDLVNNELIIQAVALLSLFLVTSVITINIFGAPLHVTPNAQPPAKPRLIFGLALISFAVGMAPYILFGDSLTEIVGAIIQSRAIEKPWAQATNLGDSVSPFTYLASSAFIASAFLLWFVAWDKRLSRRIRLTAFGVALLGTVIIFFDQGTRSAVALVIVPILIMIMLDLWRRSRIRAIVVGTCMVLGVVLLLQFQVLYRTTYTRTSAPDLLGENLSTLGGTTDYFRETLFAVHLVPTYHDYFRESAILQFVISPFPRFLWPDKPISELVRFYTLSRWGVDILQESGNTFPGLVGQYYMSWGWFGPIIIGLLFGWLTAQIDKTLVSEQVKNDLYLFGLELMLIVWLFLSFRILSPGFFYPILVAGLVVYVGRRANRKSVISNQATLPIADSHRLR